MPTQEVPVERTGVEPIDWSQVVSQMNRYLRIKQTAVAVQYFKTKEEILQIPKVRIPTRHIAPCTTISQAVQFNWTVACLPETIHINYCRGIRETISGTLGKYSIRSIMKTSATQRLTTTHWCACRHSTQAS